MISSVSTQNANEVMDIPSLFLIAAHFEDFFPPDGLKRRTVKLRQPLAKLMSHPEKLRAALQSFQVKIKLGARPFPAQPRPHAHT